MNQLKFRQISEKIQEDPEPDDPQLPEIIDQLLDDDSTPKNDVLVRPRCTQRSQARMPTLLGPLPNLSESVKTAARILLDN